MVRRSPFRVLAAGVAALAVLVPAACSDGGGEPGGTTDTTAAPTTTSSEEPTSTTSPGGPSTTTTRPGASTSTTTAPDRLALFRGLGAWVDLFDSSARFLQGGGTPAIDAGDVRRLAGFGVRTLYLQVARDDPRSAGLLADEPVARSLLLAAHGAGIEVVAWYLPTLVDPAADLARIRAILEYETGGERFDGFMLDMEALEVDDVAERSRRQVEVARETRRLAGDLPVGGAVFPAVPLEILNPDLWPGFPYRDLAPHLDVWMPMDYWTNRSPGSEWRDAYRYTVENVRRLRTAVGDPAAPVHVIGGIGDEATAADYTGFMRAVGDTGVVGWSIYDYATMTDDAWALLRR